VEWIDDQQQTHKTDYQRAVLSENEKSSWIHVGTFLVALMLLSGYLVTGLSDEREQRSLEFLLSLVSPFQLLSGKLIGVIFSGILQVCTWGLTFVFPALFFFWSMKHAFVNWLLPFFFFLAGYSFYGSILLSLSAAAASARESRQVAASWLFLSCIPLAFYPIILAQPHGSLAHVLSLIPVTAPIAMMLRLGVGQVDFWEYFLSQIILWGCSGLVIRWASSRVLRNLYRKV
jgi:ABC-2 type transport system permease protein